MIKRGTGYGAAFYGTGYGNGFPDESRATAVIKETGEIIIYVGVSDVGSGGLSVMYQIAMETLSLPKEKILIKNSNTAYMHDSGTAAASRQTYNTGNAVYDACNKLKSNMKKSGVSGSLSETYQAMIKNNLETKAEGYFKAATSQIDLETGQGNPYWPYAFGIARATVEVDDETGKVDVIEIIAVQDAGKIINPVTAEGQMTGGIAMGIGYALMEEVEVNKGSIKNRNFSGYIIPTVKDMPDIKVKFVEDLEASGPYGAKGLGEPAMLTTAPAVINAIYDAVGVRITELPATCDKLLLAIKNKSVNNH